MLSLLGLAWRSVAVNGREVDLGRATALMTDLFAVLEQRLASQPWLALDRPTIADIAVHPYVALLSEGHVDLAPRPAGTARARPVTRAGRG